MGRPPAFRGIGRPIARRSGRDFAHKKHRNARSLLPNRGRQHFCARRMNERPAATVRGGVLT